jgi:hypothetical protein
VFPPFKKYIDREKCNTPFRNIEGNSKNVSFTINNWGPILKRERGRRRKHELKTSPLP